MKKNFISNSCLLRIQKDLNSLSKDEFIDISVKKLTEINISFFLVEGPYKNCWIKFIIFIPSKYPYQSPSVKCLNKVYHPNIDQEGNVCLSVLGIEWKAVFYLGTIITSIKNILVEPSGNDPLNKKIGILIEQNYILFLKNVEKTIQGLSINGIKYDFILSMDSNQNQNQLQ